MKKLFIFDLDNTLGKKTPSWPAITKENANFLRQLSYSKDNLMFFATGRPRSQAFLGFQNGGINKEEIYKIFPGGVYEDGLFVENKERVLYDAIENSQVLFRKVKEGFFDDEAKKFFRKENLLLFPGFILKGKESPFEILDFSENKIGEELFTSLIPLFQQGNDVRETYKLPQGYLNDNLKEQSPIFEKVNKIALNYLNLRFSGWQEVGRLEKWEDAVEIYPLLEGKHFIKGEGIERLLPKINEEVKAYICCDGRNDMSLVDSIVEKFPNYHVVCPSNVSIELKKMLGDKNYNYTILQEDCTKFGEGLEKIIK